MDYSKEYQIIKYDIVFQIILIHTGQQINITIKSNSIVPDYMQKNRGTLLKVIADDEVAKYLKERGLDIESLQMLDNNRITFSKEVNGEYIMGEFYFTI